MEEIINSTPCLRTAGAILHQSVLREPNMWTQVIVSSGFNEAEPGGGRDGGSEGVGDVDRIVIFAHTLAPASPQVSRNCDLKSAKPFNTMLRHQDGVIFFSIQDALDHEWHVLNAIGSKAGLSRRSAASSSSRSEGKRQRQKYRPISHPDYGESE